MSSTKIRMESESWTGGTATRNPDGVGPLSFSSSEGRRLPFIVRTTYGVFPGGGLLDADGIPLGSAEGVRTYFSIFGLKVHLNEWGVRSHDTPPPTAAEDAP